MGPGVHVRPLEGRCPSEAQSRVKGLSEEQLEFADRQILLTQTQLPRSSWSSVTLAHFPKHCTCNHFFTCAEIYLAPRSLRPLLYPDEVLAGGTVSAPVEKSRGPNLSQWPVPAAVPVKAVTGDHRDDLREGLQSKLTLLNTPLRWHLA